RPCQRSGAFRRLDDFAVADNASFDGRTAKINADHERLYLLRGAHCQGGYSYESSPSQWARGMADSWHPSRFIAKPKPWGADSSISGLTRRPIDTGSTIE